MYIFIFVISCIINSANSQNFREDGLCGAGNLSPTGEVAGCQHIPPFPTCCQKDGHCGWSCDGISTGGVGGGSQPAPAPVAASPVFKPAPVQTFTSNGLYRPDGKCGAEHPLEDGRIAECDPNSVYYCCSAFGFCGDTQEHCFCDTCVNYRPLDLEGKVRSDRRCGEEFPLTDGSASECDGASAKPCCSKFGYCGPGPEHCDCPGCVDYRSGSGEVVPLVRGRVRTDRRCGSSFLLDDGTPSECEGSSAEPCCSKWGYCGPGDDHCACDTCVDYRTSTDKFKDWEGFWRKDRRCGAEYPLPDGSGPTECNPDSENFCCSKWGFCGGDEEHCGCPQCVNYRS